LGILGLGRLGTSCAVTGKLGFGMNIICWSSSLTQEKADTAAQDRGLPTGSLEVVASKRELFEKADVLSVHYVLSNRSRGMVGEEELDAMKKTALLINTSRGPLIDEEALLKVLEHGKIRGAALDVFDTEPLEGDSPWRSLKWGTDGRSQVLLSPHTGYVEEETMHWWYEQTAENVERYVNGQDVLRQIRP
jgi:glycerate dehydrogenase